MKITRNILSLIVLTSSIASLQMSEARAATAYAFGNVCQMYYLGHGLCQIVCEKGSCSGTECIIAKGGGVCNGRIVKAYDPKIAVDPQAGLEPLFNGESSLSETPVSDSVSAEKEVSKPLAQ